MSSEVIFALGLIIGILIGGMVGSFLMIWFIGGDDKE